MSLRVTAVWTEVVCEVARTAVGPPSPLPTCPSPSWSRQSGSCPQVVDEWFKCNDEESFAFARMLIAQEGLLCGEWRRALWRPGCRGRTGACLRPAFSPDVSRTPHSEAAWQLPRMLSIHSSPSGGQLTCPPDWRSLHRRDRSTLSQWGRSSGSVSWRPCSPAVHVLFLFHGLAENGAWHGALRGSGDIASPTV